MAGFLDKMPPVFANPIARGFWDELWPVLCDRWREEITAFVNAAAA